MQRYTYRPHGRKKGISPRTLIYAATLAVGITLAGIIGANADKIDDVGSHFKNVIENVRSPGYNGPWVNDYIPDTGMVTSFQNYLNACGINASNDVLASQIKRENDVKGVRELLGTYALVPEPCAD